MSAHDWILFASATLALNLAPGPDMLYVSARSVAQGRRAGVLSALGVAGGGVVHTTLVAFGLAGLLASIPIAYDLVRYGGAVYLVYLGLRLLFARATSATRALADESSLRIFLQGLLTNLLNPKVALFFLAFLPQFADPARGSLWWQLLLLGVLFTMSGTCVNLSVAFIVSATRRFARGGVHSGVWLRRLSAAVFVGLGARLALTTGR